MISPDPMPENQPLGPNNQNPLKNILIFVLLVVLILGSFWVSFSLGRRLLSPSRKAPVKIEVAVPEPPASIAHLQKVAMAVKKTTASKPAVKKTVKQTAVCPSTTAVKVRYYKIQAGWFSNKNSATALSERLIGDGFETLVKKSGKGWRVQTGAFRSKAGALNLQKSLKAKGYKSSIIVE